ncbi:MAG: hypothetical protein WBN56_09015 [Robiginitalea sp.]|uniref:hypothetical protein n=1 Tax=Robiginitalea sp. TaxID=1902411 RepID=UPI003C732995
MSYQGSAGTTISFFFTADSVHVFCGFRTYLWSQSGGLFKKILKALKGCFTHCDNAKRNGNLAIHLKKNSYEQRERSEVEGLEINPG